MLAWYAERVRDMRNVDITTVTKVKREGPLGRSEHSWEDIKMDLGDNGCGLD